jgi:RNA polymerase sigma factor (sigma-70 family)
MYSEPEPLSQRRKKTAVPEWPPGAPEVIAKHWIPLYQRAYAKVRDEHGATEIVENTILRHLRDPDHYPESALNRLLRWETSRWFKQQKKHRALSTANAIEELDGIFDDGPNALEKLASSEDHERIMDAVRQLKEGDRDIIIRRYLQQETIEEIADALGIQEGTLRVRLCRALKRARALLEGN